MKNMRTLRGVFTALSVALLVGCAGKGVEIKVEVSPNGDAGYVKMLIRSNLGIEVLDIASELQRQTDKVKFGARSWNNSVQVGVMARAKADVEVEMTGDSFTLAGHKIQFSDWNLSVDDEDFGQVAQGDRVILSSWGISIERAEP